LGWKKGTGTERRRQNAGGVVTAGSFEIDLCLGGRHEDHKKPHAGETTAITWPGVDRSGGGRLTKALESVAADLYYFHARY